MSRGRAKVMIVTLLYLVVFPYYSVLCCAGPERICNFLSLSSRFYSSGLFSLSSSASFAFPAFIIIQSLLPPLPSLHSFSWCQFLSFPSLSLFHTNTRYPFISTTKKGIGMRRRLQTERMKGTTQTIELEIRQEYSINFLADGRKGWETSEKNERFVSCFGSWRMWMKRKMMKEEERNLPSFYYCSIAD